MRSTVPTPRSSEGEGLGQFAFASVIVVAFGQLTLSSNLRGQPWQVPAVFLLGMVYGTLAVLSGRWTDRGTARQRNAYFIVQSGICLTMIALSPNPGYFWVIVLPLAAQGVFDLRWTWALLLALLLFSVSVAGVWIPWGRQAGYSVLLGFSPAFIFTLVFSFLTRSAVTARQRAEKLSTELTAANEQLRLSSAQAEELATTHERNRLAREIHDGLGHYLTVIHVQLEAARAVLATDRARAEESIATASRLTADALREVRESVADLRSDSVTTDLPAQVQRLAAEAGGKISCDLAGQPRQLPAATGHALYRAAQEGLTNVRKHAAAARASVLLDFRQPQRVRLTVTDDGAGPGPSRPGSGFGLRGMTERVQLLGGEVRAGPRVGGGFELIVEVPA